MESKKFKHVIEAFTQSVDTTNIIIEDGSLTLQADKREGSEGELSDLL